MAHTSGSLSLRPAGECTAPPGVLMLAHHAECRAPRLVRFIRRICFK